MDLLLSYGLLVGLFCGVGLEIWFFFVTYRAYGYFKDKGFRLFEHSGEHCDARNAKLQRSLRMRTRTCAPSYQGPKPLICDVNIIILMEI